MTISSATNKAQFSGNGVTTAFPFTFKTFAAGDLEVYLTSPAGVDSALTLTTHYTVTLAGDQDASPGGTLTMLTAPATGYTLTILRVIDATQLTDITNGGGFYPQVVENALDKLTMLAQQNAEKLDRALVAGVTSTVTADELFAALDAAVADAEAAAAAAATFDPAGYVAKTSSTGAAAIPGGTTAQRPGSPVFGDTRANSTTGSMEWWNGTAWVGMGGSLSGGAGGSIPYQSAADTTAMLANGTSGQVLTSQGGTSAPIWSSVSNKQIQPISASIAANAITVSASSLSLDFRHATLTNGTVTTVTGTPANLVIAATDSFGLVTAYGSQRLAILAINNAGTIELAASALYGGVALDETGVITTATASTTATGIKAAAVRTGVAYRVIGFIDATFTTATGWGSLTVVQGQGGQALASMSSLGYGQTVQNVTGSRVVATTYYNTTGRPIKVNIHGTLSAANASATLTVNGVDVSASQAYAITAKFFVEGIVPPGSSYVLNHAAGTATVVVWAELR